MSGQGGSGGGDEFGNSILRETWRLADQIRNADNDEPGVVGRIVWDWLIDLEPRRPWPLRFEPKEIADPALRAVALATLETERSPAALVERYPWTDPQERLARTAVRIGRRINAGALLYAVAGEPPEAHYAALIRDLLDKNAIMHDLGPWGLYAAIGRLRRANIFEREVQGHVNSIRRLFELANE